MDLESDFRDGILVLRINRPEAANALNAEVMTGIGMAMREADRDAAVRVVILTGTGDRAFCAGMDLKSFGQGGIDRTDPGFVAFTRFLRLGISKPVIGAANATAVAGGFELLLACDLIVAAETARFGLPEVKRGLFAGGGGMLLGTRIPIALALELGLTGEMIDAERAHSLGLLNRVVPSAEVFDVAFSLATSIRDNAPLAVIATKRLMCNALAATREQTWGDQELMRATVYESNDAQEGTRAFIEKRRANWSGT
jgi:enoyl-CoA hydratase